MLDKKVIYLDQFVYSNICKSRKKDEDKKETHFSRELDSKIKKVVLLQQAIFPHSDIHLDESLVSTFYEDLKKLYESIDGETSFRNHHEIRNSQIYSFAKAWVNNEGASIDFSVDKILHGKRNSWLPPLSITVNANYNQFIDDIRKSRGIADESMKKVFERWKNEKPNFHKVVKEYSLALGLSYLNKIYEIGGRLSQGQLNIQDLTHDACTINTSLMYLFKKQGINENNLFNEINKFLSWHGLIELPFNKISAYMYAALARKAANGQKRLPNQGMSNDIKMISTYMPYCDAIFIDNECASLLSEKPLFSDLQYKAKIFSYRNKDEFISYLDYLIQQAPPDVVSKANEIYGEV
jgi:hypothetical protein